MDDKEEDAGVVIFWRQSRTKF